MKTNAVKPFPWMPRLTMLALLMPLWVLIFYVIPFHMDSSMKHDSDPVRVTFYFVIPVVMVIAVFVAGCWRLAVIVVFSGFLLCGMLAEDNDREDGEMQFMVHSYFPEGTEIFCNGVKLGEVPCKIRVPELLEKVPRWTPPPQSRFLDDKRPLYTWIPWDAFLNDRFLGRRQAILDGETAAFDAKCEFWWSFRYKGSTAFGALYDGQYQYDNYRFCWPCNYFSLIYPAAYAEFDLLLKILADDSMNASPEWIAWVAANGKLYDELMSRIEVLDKDSDIKLVLRRIAKKRYGLSDTPTSQECDRAIEQLLRENSRGYLVSQEGQTVSGFDWESARIFGNDYDLLDRVAWRAVQEMGDACREPLLRRCRYLYKMDDFEPYPESNLYLIMLKEHPFPEFFEGMVRFYAVQQRGFSTLTAFDDPRLPGLFETILRKKIPFDTIGAGYRSAYLTKVCNPLLEPAVREYLAEYLPRIDLGKAANVLSEFADQRNHLEWIDKEETVRWLRSLDLGGAEKADAIARFKGVRNEDPDKVWFFPESKVPIGTFGNDETERRYFSRSEVERQLQEHPERQMKEVLRTVLGNETTDADIGRASGSLLINALQKDNEIIVRKYWQDKETRQRILELARGWYSEDYRIERQNEQYKKDDVAYRDERFRLGGTNFRIVRYEHGFYVDRFGWEYPTKVPTYFVELFAELEDPDECVYLPSVIRRVETPEATALVEKWCRSKNKTLRKYAESALDEMKYLAKLNTEARTLYENLLAGRITPDEILPDPTAWVWDGEKYVSEEK